MSLSSHRQEQIESLRGATEGGQQRRSVDDRDLDCSRVVVWRVAQPRLVASGMLSLRLALTVAVFVAALMIT